MVKTIENITVRVNYEGKLDCVLWEYGEHRYHINTRDEENMTIHPTRASWRSENKKQVLYKNPKGDDYASRQQRTIYLDATATANAWMVTQARDFVKAYDLIPKAKAAAAEAERKKDEENRAHWLNEKKRDAGPALYDLAKNCAGVDDGWLANCRDANALRATIMEYRDAARAVLSHIEA